MKFAFLFALAAAQIHLQSPISRNSTTAATEDETAQLTGPCGGKTVPGPRSQQPLQFSISLDSKNSNAEIWINAAAGENPTTFPSSLFNANFTNAGPVTIAIDLSQIPGLNGLTPATVQIIQTSADTTHDRFICLDLLVNAPVSTSPPASASRKVAILFPGQGAQHVGMGADIYKEYASARQVIDECEEALGLRLKNIMFEGPQNILTSTINAQPAILCHSIALLRVLEQDFGFDIKKCTYAMGHSLGEYLVDAIRLVRLRGEAMQKSVNNKATAMRALIVTGDYLDAIEELMPRLTRSLPGEVAEIANINSRTQIVLSGTEKGVEYAASVFHSKGYTGRSLPLPVSAPFHCSLMEPAAEIMGPALDAISFQEPKIEVISNVTAKPVLLN
ncbi:hypothetical protein HK103_002829 [Boothiomyces macroporosus]|uniref:[acyl-carrier-protein] S-malonyltransferase n=1 Tax=Boothiomyces macroporosus TaxID=261099 RepID=A0AAD5UIM7_9FUNG|nr:hypothetical protein HK103_002829 [Boothiomyces macroporosus]